jgi:hypothetical protein
MSRLRSRTTTRSFGPLRAGVRGLFDIRSLYVKLPFGYRWVIWERK